VIDPFQLTKAIIKDVKFETKDTYTYTIQYLDGEIPPSEEFNPGRFIEFSVFGVGEAPFSLSSLYQNKTFDTTIREVGDVTRFIHRYKIGDKVGIRGPYGRGWPLDEAKGKDVLLIAGGIGIAPLRPIIQEIAKNRDDYGRFEILYGARSPGERIFVDEFELWKHIPDTYLKSCVDCVPSGFSWSEKVGVVTILLEELLTKPKDSIVLTCGPEIMMHYVVKGLIDLKFSEEQVYISLERHMKCGVGQCGHCQMGPKYVCKDGPVFAYSEIKGLPDLIV
jgi:NAD(P)H-flavin reductase